MISNDLGTWVGENQVWLFVAIIMLFIKSPGGTIYKIVKRVLGVKVADEFAKEIQDEKTK
jgi:hypothetical protein